MYLRNIGSTKPSFVTIMDKCLMLLMSLTAHRHHLCTVFRAFNMMALVVLLLLTVQLIKLQRRIVVDQISGRHLLMRSGEEDTEGSTRRPYGSTTTGPPGGDYSQKLQLQQRVEMMQVDTGLRRGDILKLLKSDNESTDSNVDYLVAFYGCFVYGV